jgi:autotransporter adhesin
MNQFNNLQGQVNQNNQIALSGIAGVAAAASLPALDTGKRFNLGMGVANYQGYNALAIGGQVRVQDTVVIKITGSQSLNGGVQTGTVGAGVGWSF